MNPFKPRWPWWLQVLALLIVPLVLFLLPTPGLNDGGAGLIKVVIALLLIGMIDVVFEWRVRGRYLEPKPMEDTRSENEGANRPNPRPEE